MKICKVAAIVLVGVVVCWSRNTASEGTKKPGVKKLQGVWINESIELNGDSVDQNTVNLRLVFKGDKLYVSERSTENEGYGYRIDATKAPMYIDFLAPGGKTAIKGVFAVKGDTLSICVRLLGERPTDFTSKDGVVLLEFKKEETKRAE